MSRLLEKSRQIREQINHPWKKSILYEDKVRWNKIWVCFDALDDSQFAIDSFFNLPEFDASSGGYLFLYGLLQAFYLQQDAANNLSIALFNKEIDWANDYPQLFFIRDLRNNAIGHPTKRGNNKSFHSVGRNSINKQTFTLYSYCAAATKSTYSDFNLLELAKTQELILGELLDEVFKSLAIEVSNHKNKFKDMRIIELISPNHSYMIEKVYEGIYTNHPLAEMNFKLILKEYELIKAEIIKRYYSYEEIPGVKLVIEKLDFITSRLDTWIAASQLYRNMDAEIFMDGFDDRFKELEEMLQEIDNEFVNPN